MLVPQYIEDIFFVRSIPFDFGFYLLFVAFYIHDNNKTESAFEIQYKKRRNSKFVIKIVGILVNIGICALYLYNTLYQMINIYFIILIIMILLNIFLFFMVTTKINEFYRIIVHKTKTKSKLVKNLCLIGIFLITLLFFYMLFFTILQFSYSTLDMLLLNFIPITIMAIRTYFGIVYK